MKNNHLKTGTKNCISLLTFSPVVPASSSFPHLNRVIKQTTKKITMFLVYDQDHPCDTFYIILIQYIVFGIEINWLLVSINAIL